MQFQLQNFIFPFQLNFHVIYINRGETVYSRNKRTIQLSSKHTHLFNQQHLSFRLQLPKIDSEEHSCWQSMALREENDVLLLHESASKHKPMDSFGFKTSNLLNPWRPFVQSPRPLKSGDWQRILMCVHRILLLCRFTSAMNPGRRSNAITTTKITR